MKPVDLERFWRDNDLAGQDPFSAQGAQPPLAIDMGYECVFAELGYAYDPWRVETEPAFARAAAEAYNRRAVEIVGRPLLDENAYDPPYRMPRVKDLAEIFGCKRQWHAGSWWHMPAAQGPKELERLLDRVERMDLRAEMFPADWEAHAGRYRERVGRGPLLPRGMRGPVTLATNIYGAEDLIFLLVDERALAERFRDTLTRVIIAYFSLCDAASDATRVRPGFSFCDDNSALLTAEMYGWFGQPIVQAVFERFAPGPVDRRYQHSDSDMGHLLPLLAATGMNAVNFGPNLTVGQIRAALPKAVIYGQLAPFTFMSNNEEAIMAEVRRDCRQAAAERGLCVATSGSVNNGTKLTSLRAVMHAIQTDGRQAYGQR
ncbi:MAG: hypothetical protein IT443_09755 [Phycisphaeraceae bacterium]|nr:hypothetical protein [Phycisphaeraceae bacterium]